MLRDAGKASVRRRLAMAAVLAAGTLAPLMAVTGGAQAQAGGSVAVTNGPIVYGDQPFNQPDKLADMAMNPDGSGQRKLADAHACGIGAYKAPESVVYSRDGAMAAIGCNDGQLHLATADLSRFAVIVPWQKDHVIVPVAWSADGKTVYYNVLTFQSHGAPLAELWSVHTDGSLPGPVATIPDGYRLRSIAADGTMLLAGGPGPYSVSVLAPGASAPRLITSQALSDYSISWDGTKVATVENVPGGGVAVRVYNADGSNSGGTTVATVPADYLMGNVALSPDGRQLAYTKYLPGATPTSTSVGTQIWTVGTEGGAAPVRGGQLGSAIVSGLNSGSAITR